MNDGSDKNPMDNLMMMYLEVRMGLDVEFTEYWKSYIERLESAAKLTGYPMPTALQLDIIKIDAFDGWSAGKLCECKRLMLIFREEILNIAKRGKLEENDPEGYASLLESIGKFDEMVNFNNKEKSENDITSYMKNSKSDAIDPEIKQLFKNLGIDMKGKNDLMDTDGDGGEQSFSN